jgi:membrane protease YdiL (CAAX protease family)
VHVIGAAVATALAVLLVIVQPFRGRQRYQRLLARVATDPRARVDHYRRGIVAEWIGVAIVAVIGALTGRSAASIGLRAVDASSSVWSQVPAIVVVLAVGTVLFRRPSLRDALRRQARGFIALLPSTNEERLLFVPLAITAGVCEEILFRGFLVAYVAWLWPHATNTELIAVTSIAFGFAHLYQGVFGVLVTGIVGVLLASMVLDGGSLLPAILVHALIDLRIIFLPELSSVRSPATQAGGGRASASRLRRSHR